MVKLLKILVMAHALVGGAAMLGACGQKGPLFAPNTPESTDRATLTQTLNPWHTPLATPARPAVPSATSGTNASPNTAAPAATPR